MQKEGVSGGQTRETREKEEKRITLERKKKKKTHQLRNNVSNSPPHTKNAASTTWKVKSSLPPVLIFWGGESRKPYRSVKSEKMRQPITLRNRISFK